MSTAYRRPLEMWAGLECTINRVGDRYSDQCVLNGHDERIREDIEAFSDLGVSTLRYPILWEKVAPSSLHECDWSRSDLAMETFRQTDVRPIVGLLHHGSGPTYTSLLDPDFPEKLAAFATKVALRYPWIDAYTPVNEPLTTARFSGLYGFWYPHQRDDKSFVRALYHELRGTVLAMKAIREIQPRAILVQTEDLGRAKGTPKLQYQVDFENMRRWLTFDLLCGVVDEHHGLFSYLHERGGLSRDEILWFKENSRAPDLLGINHYPRSNRYLDHRLELYPSHLHGGNGIDRYVDLGAIDTPNGIAPTPHNVLRDVWDRYQRPFAVTEVHINDHSTNQIEWLTTVWNSAQALRSEGADIRAVTAWALLGSFGWTSLCTCEPGLEVYESGVFNVSGENGIEPTPLAQIIRALAVGRYLPETPRVVIQTSRIQKELQ